jgi:hypothetical protein
MPRQTSNGDWQTTLANEARSNSRQVPRLRNFDLLLFVCMVDLPVANWPLAAKQLRPK